MSTVREILDAALTVVRDADRNSPRSVTEAGLVAFDFLSNYGGSVAATMAAFDKQWRELQWARSELNRRLSPKTEAGGDAVKYAVYQLEQMAQGGPLAFDATAIREAAALLRQLARGGEESTARLLLRDALWSVETCEAYFGNKKEDRLSNRIATYLDDAALEPKP